MTRKYCKDCGNPDCPKVSSNPYWSQCPAEFADKIPHNIRCVYCGEFGKITGHQDCPSACPQDCNNLIRRIK